MSQGSRDIRNRIRAFYRQFPSGSREQLFAYLGHKEGERMWSIIVQVQSELRGFAPGERRNHHHGRVPG